MDAGQPISLQQAKGYLLAGQNEAARALLIDFVRQSPDSEQGWLLLGMAINNPRQQMDCYRRVLQINPNNTQAKALLDNLLAIASTTPPTVAAQVPFDQGTRAEWPKSMKSVPLPVSPSTSEPGETDNTPPHTEVKKSPANRKSPQKEHHRHYYRCKFSVCAGVGLHCRRVPDNTNDFPKFGRNCPTPGYNPGQYGHPDPATRANRFAGWPRSATHLDANHHPKSNAHANRYHDSYTHRHQHVDAASTHR